MARRSAPRLLQNRATLTGQPRVSNAMGNILASACQEELLAAVSQRKQWRICMHTCSDRSTSKRCTCGRTAHHHMAASSGARHTALQRPQVSCRC